jgi:hypothetical protein
MEVFELPPALAGGDNSQQFPALAELFRLKPEIVGISSPLAKASGNLLNPKTFITQRSRSLLLNLLAFSCVITRASGSV